MKYEFGIVLGIYNLSKFSFCAANSHLHSKNTPIKNSYGVILCCWDFNLDGMGAAVPKRIEPLDVSQDAGGESEWAARTQRLLFK